MSDLARDLIKDSYARIEANTRRRRLVLIILSLVYVILYVPLIHLTGQSLDIQDSLFELDEDKTELSGLGEQITQADKAIHNASKWILQDFVSRLRQDFACLEQSIQSVGTIPPETLPEFEGRFTVNCSLNPGSQQIQQQQQSGDAREQQQRPSRFGPDPAFPVMKIAAVFGQTKERVPDLVQTKFIEKFLVKPRLVELNSIWRKWVLPDIQKELSEVAARLEETAVKDRKWSADYEKITADLQRAQMELSRFEFSEPPLTGSRPWWRSVGGKEGYSSFELERLDEKFGTPKVVSNTLARLNDLEDARAKELEGIESQISKLNDQLKATVDLVGGEVGAGAYVSLPIVSIAPTLPLVLGMLFAAFLAESSEERKRFDDQLNVYTQSSAEDTAFLRAIRGRRRTATTTWLAAALAGIWVIHAAYEASRLDPASLTKTGASAGVGLALLVAAVVFANSLRIK